MTYTMTRCTCLEVGADFDCSVHGPCQGCYEVTDDLIASYGPLVILWQPQPEQETR